MNVKVFVMPNLVRHSTDIFFKIIGETLNQVQGDSFFQKDFKWFWLYWGWKTNCWWDPETSSGWQFFYKRISNGSDCTINLIGPRDGTARERPLDWRSQFSGNWRKRLTVRELWNTGFKIILLSERSNLGLNIFFTKLKPLYRKII